MDTRKVEEKRSVIYTIKLTEAEAESLRQLAEKNCRRPADQLRFLLHQATQKETPVDG